MEGLGRFSEDSVESFREGLSERFDFADCADDERMVFGACRKIGGSKDSPPATDKPKSDKDFDSSKKTKQEEELEAEAKKQGSTFDNNKPFTVNGKKYGWAKKDGKMVAVEWGAVAGEKKVGPKKPKKPQKPKSPKDEEAQKAEERKSRIREMSADGREKLRTELLRKVQESDAAKSALKELEDVLRENI